MLQCLLSLMALYGACQCSLPAPAWAVVALCLCPEVSGHLLTAGVDFLPSILSPCAPVPGTAVTPLCSWPRDQSPCLGKPQSRRWLLHPAVRLCWRSHPAALGSDVGSLLPVFRKIFGHLKSRCLKRGDGLAGSQLMPVEPGPRGTQGSGETVS